MIDTILTSLKTLAIIVCIVGLLTALGLGISVYLPWSYLGIGFTLLYQTLMLFNFMFDVPILWQYMGYGLLILIVFSIYKAGIAVVSRFTGSQD